MLQLALQLLNLSSYVLEKDATPADWLALNGATFVQGAGWAHNVYTPALYRSLVGRRAIICLWGEVFWQEMYSERCDVVVSRSRHRLPTTARLVHYTQYSQYKSRFEVVPCPKTKRCAFMTSYVTKFSGAESLARWALFALTARRYGCEFIGKASIAKNAGLGAHIGEHCLLSWHLCFKDYRVAVVGENSIYEGYVTEKLALPQLVGAKPLYVGAPDAQSYTTDLVECTVSPTSLAALRKLATRRKWHVQASNAELVNFATILLAPDFEPCLAAIGSYM